MFLFLFFFFKYFSCVMFFLACTKSKWNLLSLSNFMRWKAVIHLNIKGYSRPIRLFTSKSYPPSLEMKKSNGVSLAQWKGNKSDVIYCHFVVALQLKDERKENIICVKERRSHWNVRQHACLHRLCYLSSSCMQSLWENICRERFKQEQIGS